MFWKSRQATDIDLNGTPHLEQVGPWQRVIGQPAEVLEAVLTARPKLG